MKEIFKLIGILAGLAAIAGIVFTVFVMIERSQMLSMEQPAQSIDLSEPAFPTPTPEVVMALNPSPTPSGSDLPLTCQITDLNIYLDEDAGYCFAYPKGFMVSTQPMLNKTAVMGPARGSDTDPIFASFVVESMEFDPGKSLDQQVDDFLRGFTVVAPESLTRAKLTVAGEAAVLVDVVPVHLSWRIVFVPHAGEVYRLMYWPVDVPEAQTDIEELYQTSLNSFAFLP